MSNPIVANAKKLTALFKEYPLIAYAHDTGGTVGCRRCDIYTAPKCKFKWEYSGDASIQVEKDVGVGIRLGFVEPYNLKEIVMMPIIEKPEQRHHFNIYEMKTLAENTFEVKEGRLDYSAVIFATNKPLQAVNFASKQLEENVECYGIHEPTRIDGELNPKKRGWISDMQWQNCLEHAHLILQS